MILFVVNMDVDSSFGHIGQLGRQQLKYVLMLAMLRMTIAVHFVSYAFVGKKINFTCIGWDAIEG